MAGTTSSQIKNLRESQMHNKEGQFLKGNQESDLTTKSKKNNPVNLISRYEKHCRNWSILANIAAIISVTSAVYTFVKKQRRWL